jgi:hypothetical protein
VVSDWDGVGEIADHGFRGVEVDNLKKPAFP